MLEIGVLYKVAKKIAVWPEVIGRGALNVWPGEFILVVRKESESFAGDCLVLTSHGPQLTTGIDDYVERVNT